MSSVDFNNAMGKFDDSVKQFDAEFDELSKSFDAKFKKVKTKFKENSDEFDKDFKKTDSTMKEMHHKQREIAKANYCFEGFLSFATYSTVGLALTAGVLYVTGNVLAIPVGIAALVSLTVTIALKIFLFCKKYAGNNDAEKDFDKLGEQFDHSFDKRTKNFKEVSQLMEKE